MKYYAVKRGLNPGIYTTWDDCKEQILGFSDAKYKSFTSRTDAENYLSQTEELINSYPTSGLAVDASLLKKDSAGEFQVMDLSTKTIVYKSPVFKNTTVNVMEFLAIVKAIELSKSDNQYEAINIYSDSATAITWVLNKQINTKIKLTEELEVLIDSAITILNSGFQNRIFKWDTKTFKDIPADYNRK